MPKMHGPLIANIAETLLAGFLTYLASQLLLPIGFNLVCVHIVVMCMINSETMLKHSAAI